MADTHRIHRQVAREVAAARRSALNAAMTTAYNITVQDMEKDLGRRPVPAEVIASWAAWLATYESTE